MFATTASWIATGIEAAGILAVFIGALASTSAFLRRLVRTKSFSDSYPAYRSDLGRSTLLGLERNCWSPPTSSAPSWSIRRSPI